MSSEPRPVCVIYEDDERTEKLIEAILAAGFPPHLLRRWVVVGGNVDIDPTQPLDRSVLYMSRLSASASMRKHDPALGFGRTVLEWLDANGCDVINGKHAFELEVSKVRQCIALQGAGIAHPLTKAVSCQTALVPAAKQWLESGRIAPDTVLYVKPDTGGSGHGVARFVGVAKLEAAVKTGRGIPTKAWKGVTQFVLQVSAEERVDWFHLTKKKLVGKKKVFYRAEFVDQAFLYLLRIAVPVEINSTCPCDAPTRFDNEFDVVPDPGALFGPEAWSTFLASVAACMKDNAMFVAAFEFSRPDPSGPLVVYDINANTNYNDKAEKKAALDGRGGGTGMGAVAAMIGKYTAC